VKSLAALLLAAQVAHADTSAAAPPPPATARWLDACAARLRRARDQALPFASRLAASVIDRRDMHVALTIAETDPDAPVDWEEEPDGRMWRRPQNDVLLIFVYAFGPEDTDKPATSAWHISKRSSRGYYLERSTPRGRGTLDVRSYYIPSRSRIVESIFKPAVDACLGLR
jgi:hypothetical protein